MIKFAIPLTITLATLCAVAALLASIGLYAFTVVEGTSLASAYPPQHALSKALASSEDINAIKRVCAALAETADANNIATQAAVRKATDLAKSALWATLVCGMLSAIFLAYSHFLLRNIRAANNAKPGL